MGETDQPRVVGVLLAGGRARRFGGGDKCLLSLGDRTLLDAVIGRAAPQVACLLLNVNGDADRFAGFRLPTIGDAVDGFAGPLAGILAALEWTRVRHPGCPLVASFATDTPFLPADFVGRSMAALRETGADIACARSRGRAHPVFGLWPVRLADALRRALQTEGVRKIDAWTGRFRVVHVDFADHAGVDPFFNVNEPEDLAEAARLSTMLAAPGPAAARDDAA